VFLPGSLLPIQRFEPVEDHIHVSAVVRRKGLDRSYELLG
jgi:hypothetical protein